MFFATLYEYNTCTFSVCAQAASTASASRAGRCAYPRRPRPHRQAARTAAEGSLRARCRARRRTRCSWRTSRARCSSTRATPKTATSSSTTSTRASSRYSHYSTCSPIDRCVPAANTRRLVRVGRAHAQFGLIFHWTLSAT